MAVGTPTAEQIKKADEALKRKRANRAAAEKQAAADARVVETPAEDHTKTGRQVPLHLLNQNARTEDRAIKAKNAEAAKAAAIAVNTVLAGKTRPKPKTAVKASAREVTEADTAAAAEAGPTRPPKGSTSTKPLPAGTGTKAKK